MPLVGRGEVGEAGETDEIDGTRGISVQVLVYALCAPPVAGEQISQLVDLNPWVLL